MIQGKEPVRDATHPCINLIDSETRVQVGERSQRPGNLPRISIVFIRLCECETVLTQDTASAFSALITVALFAYQIYGKNT